MEAGGASVLCRVIHGCICLLGSKSQPDDFAAYRRDEAISVELSSQSTNLMTWLRCACRAHAFDKMRTNSELGNLLQARATS
jgi:hypothetical protein